MKNVNKLLALGLSVAMIFGVAACGNDTPANTQSTSESKTTSESSVSTATSEVEEEKEQVVLKMIKNVDPASDAAVQALNEKFMEEYPWITIDLTLEGNNYGELQKTRLAAEDVDIMSANIYGSLKPEWVIGATPGQNALWAREGLILDITGEEFLDNWSADLIESYCSLDGKVYGVPGGFAATNGLYYNKKMFEQYNLSEPKTWQEFIDLCETLKANGVAPLTSGVKDGWPTNMLWYAIVSSCEEDALEFVHKLWSGDRKFNDDETMKIWKKIEQLTPYWEDNIASVDYGTVTGRFVSGKAAMMNDATWSATVIKDADPNFEFGYFAIPGDKAPADGGEVQLKGKPEGGWVGIGTTKHPEEVKLWMEFYSRPENYQDYINACGLLPTMAGIEMTDPFMATLSEKAIELGDHFESVYFKPSGTGQYATFYASRFLTIYGGEIDKVEDLANLAQKDWEEAMTKVKNAQ